MLIDCHLHVIDTGRLSYPWLDGFDALKGDFLYETYALEAKRTGIGATLHMEVDVAPSDIGRETEMLKDIARRPGSLIRGAISSCRPEEKEFPALLETALQDDFLKGFRRVLHVVPDDLSEGALFRENIRRLEKTRLTFDLCTLPHQVDKVLALADLAPGVTFILDHCGVPAIASNAHAAWAKGIAEIAKRPNVLVKLSGIVAYADAGSWQVQTLRPYVETVLSTFGPSRMLWGSDWPVCTLGGTLSTWVAATHALLDPLSKDEKQAILSGNATRLWSLPEVQA